MAKEATFKLRASWLVCRRECIPEEGEFTLQVPLQGTTALHGAAFQAAADAQPRPLAVGGGSQAQVEGDALVLRVAGLPAPWQGAELGVFAETPDVVQTAAPPPTSAGSRTAAGRRACPCRPTAAPHPSRCPWC